MTEAKKRVKTILESNLQKEAKITRSDVAGWGEAITDGRPIIPAIGLGALGAGAGYFLGPRLVDMFARARIPGVRGSQRLTPDQRRRIGYRTGIAGGVLGAAPFAALALSQDNPLGRAKDE